MKVPYSNQTLLRLQIYTLAIFCYIILTGLPAAFHNDFISSKILVDKQLKKQRFFGSRL